MTADITHRVAEIVASVLQVDARDPDRLTRRDVPEWDSLSQLEIVFSIEEEFGVRFEREVLPTLTSVADLAGAVGGAG